MIKNQRKKKSNLLMLPGHCFLQNELFLTLNSYEKKKKKNPSTSETPTG